MKEEVYAYAWARFERASWHEMKPGDNAFYMTIRKEPYAEDHAHGPFKILDPKKHKVENQRGVKLTLGDNIQLLKFASPHFI